MKLTSLEAARFFRSLSLLLHAGLSMADGLHLLSQEEAGEKRKLLETMGAAMDRGLPLYTVMEEAAAFPEAATAMVQVGETTGRLEDTLLYLADYYDQQAQTVRQVKNALAYPALILVLMLAVIFVLLMEVLPVFDRVYASLGSGLTGLAGGLLVLGQGLKSAMPVLLVVLAAAAGAFLLYRFVKPLRESCNKWVLKTLGDRSFARKFNNAQFARAMAMGLASGMALEEAMGQAAGLLEHIPGAARRCRLCSQLLEQGGDLAESMEQVGLLDPALGKLLSLGLRSGSGDKTMAQIAQSLSRQAREDLEDKVAKVEPAMVLLCSLLVGAILLAVMLPLMDIMGAIG